MGNTFLYSFKTYIDKWRFDNFFMRPLLISYNKFHQIILYAYSFTNNKTLQKYNACKHGKSYVFLKF